MSSFLLDDGGKLHGGLKMFGAGPEPESFEVAAPARARAEVEGAEVVDDPASIAESLTEGGGVHE